MSANNRSKVIHTNYYFDTPNFSAYNHNYTIRIRETIDNKILTIKSKNKSINSIRESREINIELSDHDFNLISIQATIPNEYIRDIPNLKYNKFNYLGSLTTHRVTFELGKAKIMLDKNLYLNKIDYELEIESEEFNTTELRKYTKELAVTEGKYSRFLKEYIAFKDI